MIFYTFLLVMIDLQRLFVSICQQAIGESFALEPESNYKVSRFQWGHNSETSSSNKALLNLGVDS